MVTVPSHRQNGMLHQLWNTIARDLLYVPSHRTEWYVAPFVECNSKGSFICTILQTVVCCTTCGLQQQGIFYMYHLKEQNGILHQLWSTIARDLLYVPFHRLLYVASVVECTSKGSFICTILQADCCMLHQLGSETARDLLYVPSHRQNDASPIVEHKKVLSQ